MTSTAAPKPAAPPDATTPGTAPMSLRSTISEAWRNLATGTTRALSAALALTLILAALAELEIATTGALVDRVRAFVAAGASTYVISADDNIDAAACSRLAVTGVLDRAGALRVAAPVTLTAMPWSPIQMMEVTPGLLDLIAPTRREPAGQGVYASTDLADTIAPLANSRTVSVPPMTVLGTYAWPDDGRPAPLQYAALAPAPATGAFDQCWARATDPTVDGSYLLRSVLIRTPSDPTQVTLTQLNSSLGAKLTARDDFTVRPSRWAWAAAALGGLLLSMVLVWLRRVELAAGRAVGVPLASQLLGALLEAGVWSVAACLLSAPYVLMRANAVAASDQTWVALLAVPIGLGALCGVAIGTLLAVALVSRRPVEAYLRTR